MKQTVLALILAAAVGPWAVPARAQQPLGDPADAPEHGVARISVIQGSVSVRRGDGGELSAAAVNAPLVVDDRLVTGDGGRAEVQFDATNMIRLAESSEVRFSQLEYKQYQVQIATGTITFRVLRDNDAQVEISTPSVSVRPSRQGNYRVTVEPDGTSQITVREGQAEIFTPQGSQTLGSGRTMLARGSASDPEYQVIAEIPRDDWDSWNQDLDRQLQQAVSSRYVSPDVYGTESLDPYGRWTYDPAYGQVWVPTVDAGWAPYRVGRWVWLDDYYGWTWVSGDPWGWAPYHYGNWYYGNLGWAWYPGPFVSRCYWRPALVGFFGWGGGGFGFGFGFGNVGWVPLAPYEAFHPWYGRGFYGGNRFNIVNVNVVNVYHNARYVNAVTSVHAGDFGRGPVGLHNYVRASSGDLARAGQVRGAMAFAPSRESRLLSDRTVSTRGVPQMNSNTRFYSRSGWQTAGGGRIANAGASGVAAPASRGASGFRGANEARSVGGTVRPAGGTNSARPAGGTNSGAWRRFDPAVDGPGASRGGSSRFEAGGGQRAGAAASAPPQNQRGGSTVSGSGGRLAGTQNGGGWRRFEGSGGGASGGAPAARSYSGAASGNALPRVYSGQVSRDPANRGGSSAQGFGEQPNRGSYGRQSFGGGSRGFAPQEPIRINPPIVRDRGAGQSYNHPQSHFGDFGSAHSFGGGNRGGGSVRGGGGGGGYRGGGGGNRGGGGGGNRGGGGGRRR